VGLTQTTSQMELKITTLQLDLVWENKTQNLQKIDEILRGVGKTDVIVLPEMFTTGFSMTPEKWAEPMFGETFNWLKTKALEYDTAITGSFICEENGQYFNRLIWMQPDGTFYKYDKRHLFSLAGEQHHYKEGVKRITIEWRGWQICPLVCYDLRFPVWSRNTLNFQNSDFSSQNTEGVQNTPSYYDVLIYVANWPAIRANAWKSLLVARAIENQAYVVGVNRVGNDGNQIWHSGDSAVIDFKGGIIFETSEKENISTTILNRGDLLKFRNKFGFLNDQDSFKINVKK
jgi:omega-amidase